MVSSILLNHVGFPCLAPKRFLIKNPPAESFRVERLLNTRLTPVDEGTLRPLDGGVWEGDFSDLTDEGDYQIVVGEAYSRNFVVYDRVYDMAERLMLGYFTMQRCGSPLGWAGLCHQEDGYVGETGERVDLTGGYHQSADLRKSLGGVPIGVIGLLHWAALRKPLWDQGAVKDEIRWACDHYLRMVQPNGCVYNTLNAPLGWDGRLFYAEGAPASAQWNVIVILAMGARLLADDAAFSARLLAAARRAWRWIDRPERSDAPYRHPDVLPRGMDADNFYYASFRDSTADLCGRLSAAVALLRAEGGEAWEKEIVETANRLCGRQVPGGPDNPVAGALRLAEDDLRLLGPGGSYGWAGTGILSLCEACDALPLAADKGRWVETIVRFADMRARFSLKNPWRLTPVLASESNLTQPTGHPAPGRKPAFIGDSFRDAPECGCIENAAGKREKCYVRYSGAPLLLAESALVLRRAARLSGKREYLPVAQAQLDAVLGGNEYDMSSVEAVGFNQPCPAVFGQFFPSTPQIPGGVYHTGAGPVNPFNGRSGEYDMPAVGLLMWAVAELGQRPEYAYDLYHAQYDDVWGKKG